MNAFLDRLWEKIVIAAIMAANGFDALLKPLHILGPAILIAILAVVTVFITKGLNRLITTKRYNRLEKEFKHLYQLRQEAINCEDREKGKRMARNIDKGELNRVYYDYFFEGLLLGIARKIIPIFFVFAYLNEYFKPTRLAELFGREYIFKFHPSDSEPTVIGAVAWYFISLLLMYLAWSLVKLFMRRWSDHSPGTRPTPNTSPTIEKGNIP